MNGAEHRALREMLGAFVLGGLAAAEVRRVEDHLGECSTCRGDLAAISPVAQLLAEAAAEAPRPTATPTIDDPPPGLADRVVTALDDARLVGRRRRAGRAALLALATGAAASLATVLVMNDPAPDQAAVEIVQVRAGEPGVEAAAGLVAHTWGVEIKLDAVGLDAGETFRVSIITADGETRSAGEFVGTGSRELHCNLNSGVLRPDAVGFLVLDDQDHEVLGASFAG